MARPTTRTPTLSWGVKASFRGYVLALSDGAVVLTDRYTSHDGTAFVFEAAPGEPAGAGDGAPCLLRFRGGVEFSGHRGILMVRIRDPWLHLAGGRGRLSIMHPAYREPTPERVDLAELHDLRAESEDDTVVWWTATPRLRPTGVRTFGETYAAGTALDPLTFSVPAPRPAGAPPASPAP